ITISNGGNLWSYLKNKTTPEDVFEISLTELLPIAEQITLGVQHLHNQNIIHKDLRPENILMNDGIPKISDMDHLRKLMTSRFLLSMGAYCPSYSDPQAFITAFFEPSFASDIYSLGLILWELSSGVLPFSVFKDKRCLGLYIYKGLQNEIIKGTPIEYSQVYKQCWDIDPKNRPGLDEILLKIQLSKGENKTITNNIKEYNNFLSNKITRDCGYGRLRRGVR
ncbi:28318_t:CDS:2, partial [Gigaspora margarita]